MPLKQIKHFSFDLWFTLIRSNPEFKEQRAIYFYKHYNVYNRPLEEVKQIFRQVDEMCNNINQVTGKNIDTDEMCLMVIHLLNGDLSHFGTIDSHKMYDDMEQILFSFIPVLYDENTKATLEEVKSREGVTTNILSNTAFIKGRTLKVLLDHLEISQYIDFQIYSDEIGVSKPNPKIFNLLLNQLQTVKKYDQIEKFEILHVGDNVVADIEGAKHMGLSSYQINTNDNSIINILDL